MLSTVSHAFLSAYLILLAVLTAAELHTTTTRVIMCILAGIAGLLYAVRAIKE